MIVTPKKLTPGDHLSAANWNDLVDYVRRITPIAGDNVSIDYTLGGCRVNGTPGGTSDSTLEPFTVAQSGEDWIVYIPSNAVDLAGTTVILEEVDGQDDWYKIQGVGSLTSFGVFAHVKGRVRLGSETVSHPCVTVTAGSYTGNGTPTDAASCAGDIKCVMIANVSSGSLEQKWTGAITAQLAADETLELFWKVSAVGQAFIPWVKGTTFYLGGSTAYSFTVADTALATSGTAWGEVYLVLDCSTDPPTATVASASQSGTAKRSIEIYSLSSGRVTYDLRKALYTTIFYP